jgi:asparagine synthase (glutamine-hydrolysing)
MCGIAGFLDYRKNFGPETINNMTASLYTRGPDDGDTRFIECQSFNLALGHRRLSILDLSNRGRQPMSYMELTIVYNGEIYNFESIRSELEFFGYVFTTDTDTEVLLKAYHKWGGECVHKLVGMFAFAVCDLSRNEIVLFRDRAGVKPLYWSYQDGKLLFASQIKAFQEIKGFSMNLDMSAFNGYLQYGYISGAASIFENIKKLEPGCCLTFDINQRCLTIKRYWNLFDYYRLPKIEIPEGAATQEVNRLLISACNHRMVSDVEVGIFLSGGYDSSLVSAILQYESKKSIKTFSIGFKETDYNEANYANQVANYLGTDHHELYCESQDADSIIQTLPEVWDEPFADPSAIPTLFLSRFARNHVKVALSADGGDEVFGGYSKYQRSLMIGNLIKFFAFMAEPLKSRMLAKIVKYTVEYTSLNFGRKLSKFIELIQQNAPVDVMLLYSRAFSSAELEALINGSRSVVQSVRYPDDSDFSEIGELEKLLGLDFNTYQADDILVKVDRATMSVGLEGREPLLDHNLIQYVAQLPEAYKVSAGKNKRLLKNIAHQYIPKKILDRPKKGFGVPLNLWLRDDLKFYVTEYLSNDRISKRGLLDVKRVETIRDKFLSGQNANVAQIWNIIVFELWADRWL